MAMRVTWSAATLGKSSIADPAGVTVTPDGESLVLEGTSLVAKLDGESPHLSMALLGSLEGSLSVDRAHRLVGFLCHLRGNVVRSRHARVSLVVNLGEETRSFLWGDDWVCRGRGPVEDQFLSEPFTHTAFAVVDRLAEGSVTPGEGVGGVINPCILPPLQPLTLNVLLTAQRASPEETVLANLHSVIITAVVDSVGEVKPDPIDG